MLAHKLLSKHLCFSKKVRLGSNECRTLSQHVARGCSPHCGGAANSFHITVSTGAGAATGRRSLEEVVAADSLAIIEETHHWCRLPLPVGLSITLRTPGGKFIDLMVSEHVLAVEGNEVYLSGWRRPQHVS